MTVSPIARADAAFQEQVHAQWRDWCAYVRAHLTLLDAQAAERQDAFERADSLEDQLTQAERDLSGLPGGQRALFDQIREMRRQQVQIAAESAGQGTSGRERPIDPDVVDRQALVSLLAEAEGTASGGDRLSGWGDVPLMVDGAVQWYRVNVAALLDAPNAAIYAAGRTDAHDIRQRIMLSIALVIGTILFLIVWFIWPRGGHPATAHEAVPTGNGAVLAVWPIRTLELTAASGEAWTIPLSATYETSWPTQAAAPNAPLVGYWRSTAFAPLVVCAPNKTLTDLTSIRLIGARDIPDRVYAVVAARSSAVDLVIEPCHSGTDAAAPTRYGTFQTTVSMAARRVGESASLSGSGDITVRAISIVGPGQAPTLPANMARVLVQVQGSNIDWPTYAPTLLLASGQAVQSPEQVATVDGVELHYLIPLPASDLEVGWNITLPGTDQVLRWRAMLAPPPSRDAVLRAALMVREVKVLPSEQRAGVVLRITLANQGDQSLQLARDDLALTQGPNQLTIPDLASLHSPLASNETRTLDLPLPNQAFSPPLVVTIGAERFQIGR
jgi:hypothetical protein